MSEQPPQDPGPQPPQEPWQVPPPQYGGQYPPQPGQYPPQPGQYQPQPGYQMPPPTPGNATAALVLGIAGLIMCPLILSIPAWIVGRNAVKQIDASQGQLGGRSMANAGYIMGIIGTILGILAIIAIVVVILAFPDSCTSTSTDTSFSFNCS
ncbi:DUF4190 domain-containing protein [Nocardioides marmoriginsengisoli]|uniref:DUF4190 domain-containing protein n=1 Tax=Nocardioides marmoriginsengisoli TaxID=661483 RepID=A0A3N0CNJ0_9ACTN|nr:DUF4190 domain-containing protein [Nocardioides marmoriginsengisoli]RNL65032.1 DUF4190 domain-containing protein [Nocardioides marmoriginsengisoli]